MAIWKELLFNDGEGLDYRDLNNIQRYQRAHTLDGLVRMNCKAEERNSYAADFLSCEGNGGIPYVTGASMTVFIDIGMIYQCSSTATPDGIDAITKSYYVSSSEFSFVIGASHATLERYDLIQVAITDVDGTSTTRDFKDATTGVLSSQSFNKARNSTCTMSVKVGTNAAVGAAVEPTPDAGYVKLATVLVAPTVTVIAKDAVRDYRVPSRLRVIDVHAAQASYDSALWTLQSDRISIARGAGASSDVKFFPSPGLWSGGRLVAVGLSSQSTLGQIYLESWDFAGSPIIATAITPYDLTTKLRNGSSSRYCQFNLLRHATQPFWMDGSSASSGQLYEEGWATLDVTAKSATELRKVALTFSNNGFGAETLTFARFIIAG